MSILTVDRPGAAPSAGDRDTDDGGREIAYQPRRRTFGAPVQVVLAYVVLVVLIPPTYIIGPLGAVGTPATVLALGALVLWGIAVVTPGDYLCRTVVPVRVVTVLLIGTMFVSYALAHMHYIPAVELLASDRAMLQALSWVGIGLLAAEGLRDRDEVYRVLRTLVAVVAIMAMVGLLQFRFGTDLAAWVGRIPGLHANTDLVSIQDRSGFRRPAGTATHPIEFGCVIAMVLPLALHLARFDLVRTTARRWLPLAAIAIGIPVAVSRSAVLAAVVACVVIFVGLEPRLRPRALGAVAAFILATYATTPGLLGTLRSLFVNFNSDTSITYRTSDYKVVGEYIQQSPWFGRGPGTFLSDVYIVLDNQYLMSAIEVGLVGLAVVIVYLLATAFLGRGVRHRSDVPAVRDLGQALAAGSVASAVATVTFDAFSFRMFAGLIPLCLGLAGALWMMQRSGERLIGSDLSLDGGWPALSGFVAPEDRPDPPVDEWREELASAVIDRDGAARMGEAIAPVASVTGSVDETCQDADDDEPAIGNIAGSSGPAAQFEDRDGEVVPPRETDGETAGDGDRVHTHDLRQLFALAGAGIALLVLAILPLTMDRGDGGATATQAEQVSPGRRPAPTTSTTTATMPTVAQPSGVAGRPPRSRGSTPTTRSTPTTTRTAPTTRTSPTTAPSSGRTTLPIPSTPGTTAPTGTTTVTSPATTTTAPPTTTTTPPETTTTTATTTTTTDGTSPAPP